MSDILCPCGSGNTLANCCGPYLEGLAATDATALVRSRFTAFCLQKYAYLVETTHPDFRDDLTPDTIRENMQGVRWVRLDIREAGATTPPEEGAEPFETVTFSALYEREGVPYQLAETSYFRREGDRLYYVEGLAHRPLGYRRTAPKVGRNDPCPCGSGKKYKKCCALKTDAAE